MTDLGLDVTGRGIVSSLGQSVEAFTAAIFAGRSAIGDITDLGFGLRFTKGAPIRDFDPAAHFESHGLGLSDGRDFGAPGWLRLNFGCPQATLDEALQRLHRACAAA